MCADISISLPSAFNINDGLSDGQHSRPEFPASAFTIPFEPSGHNPGSMVGVCQQGASDVLHNMMRKIKMAMVLVCFTWDPSVAMFWHCWFQKQLFEQKWHIIYLYAGFTNSQAYY